MSNPFKFSSIIAFINGDVIAPTINTLTPADNATGVSNTDNFVIVFSEAVTPVSGNINLYKSDDTLIEAIDVTSGQVTGGGTATITINPSASLLPLTAYYIKIDATAFDDMKGNSFAGIADKTTWNFTTIGGDSDTYMIVSTLDPDELDTYVDGTLAEKKMGTQHKIYVPLVYENAFTFVLTGGQSSGSVTFPTAFAVAPIVICTPPYQTSFWITSVSTTGFTINVGSTNAYNTTWHCIAIQQL